MRELREVRRRPTVLERLGLINNEQWGNVTGCIAGFGFGLWCVMEYEPFANPNFAIQTFMRLASIPGFIGASAVIFSHMGAAIDVITDKKTVLTWIVRKRLEQQRASAPARINPPVRLVHVNAGSSQDFFYTDSSLSGGSEASVLHSSSLSEDSRDGVYRQAGGNTSPRGVIQEHYVPDDHDLELGYPLQSQAKRQGYQPIK